LRVICSDKWKPYLKVIAEKAGSALNVLDPFHVAQHLNTAVDTVRRGEQSRLKGKQARTRVKGSRFLRLKRGTRVRGKAREKLHNVLAALKATSRASELEESFRNPLHNTNSADESRSQFTRKSIAALEGARP